MTPPQPPDRTRRQLLAAGSAALALGSGLLPRRADALPQRQAPAVRSLAFQNLHTGETLRAVYWEQGRYLPQALHEVDHLLRDFRTGEVHPIDLGLLDLLYAMRRQVGTSQPIQLISGYRSAATNAALRARSHGVARASLHMRGMAADIRIPGLELSRLRDLALSLRAGGVGFYPRSDFVHVDVGAVRRWNGV
jgi:uncharacterized protein YcbK (DUF882 family)|nr:DUF882 domain-containing protein [Ralstonia mannitolilytica]